MGLRLCAGSSSPELPPARCSRADAVGDRIYHRGKQRRGPGLPSMAGPPSAAWYPITPSTSLAEAFHQLLPGRLRVDRAKTGKNRFAIVQAEDEIASIGIVVGAGWNGAAGSFTATSGPGISLMTGVHRPEPTSPRSRR